MRNYLNLLQDILENGVDKNDRTGVGTRSVFGRQLRFSLERFPIVTTKKIHLKSVIHELLWFLSGDVNIAYLKNNNVRIWDEWVKSEDGNLGPIYGHQWRRWNGHRDQISEVIENIKKNPDSRRHIVTSWNPDDINKMALPPCHCLFQFYVVDGKLSCQLYQRSCDAFLGVPFNISSYALLTMMIAQVCKLKSGEFIHTYGDVHIYKNHFNQVKLQLSRETCPLPVMKINPKINSIFEFKYNDFSLEEYEFHPKIKAKVAV